MGFLLGLSRMRRAGGPQIKSSLISTGFFTDSLPTHVVAGLGAGFLAVCVGSPVDVVKSRMMGARPPRA